MPGAAQDETRHEQYLRILKQDTLDPADYEAAKYLVDQGYSDSPVRISSTKISRPVEEIIWCGPNARGLDYIDELESQLAETRNIENNKAISNPPKNNKNGTNYTSHHWYQKPIGIIGLTVFSGLLILFLAYIFRTQLGIPL